tara:strand:- start:1235 stop:1510 length:276 start_codon:yes stop_codon:yes gene_type:complete
MLNKDQKDYLEGVLVEYNAKWTEDNPPPLSAQLDFLVSNNDISYEDSEVLELMHFFFHYKQLDTTVEEFLDVLSAMGDIRKAAEEEEEGEY